MSHGRTDRGLGLLEVLRERLLALGVRQGDLLYVASDITRLLVAAQKNEGVKSKADRNAFLHGLTDMLQSVTGQKGTLLFPVFTWDFCRGKSFNAASTNGEVGVYNNWILQNRHDFIRTKHPIYSFMVWGKHAEELAAMDNQGAWDEASPFAFLHHNGGKQLLLGCSLQRGFTFMHYVEASLHVPYRYEKAFRGEYIQGDGTRAVRTYTMYVRDLDIVSREYLPDSWLTEEKVSKICKCCEIPLALINLPQAYDVLKADLMKGGRHCYRFTDYNINWQGGATHDDDWSALEK